MCSSRRWWSRSLAHADVCVPKVADISFYIGSGTVSASFSNSSIRNLDTPAGLTLTNWSASLSGFTYTMVYGYDAPEPSAGLLAGLGLAAVVLAGRRLRTRS